MTSQNVTGKDIKAQEKPVDETAPKTAKPSAAVRELTDDEIAAVAGGLAVGSKMNPS